MNSELILKEQGLKKTRQRVQILDYFQKKKRVTLKDIVNDNKEINQSTIYRILDLLEDKNIIVKVYEHCLYYLLNYVDHIHYIECVNCHKQHEIRGCPYNNIDLGGYQIKSDETIKGICKDCQKKKNFGIFVGSFNPVTKAHFEIGKLLYKKKIVDEIIYVPCNSLHKDNLIAINIRFEMLKRITQNFPYLKVDDIEIINESRYFSYQEMSLLSKKYLGKLYIILGADNFIEFEKWSNSQYLLEHYNFIVINRFDIDLSLLIREKYSSYQEKIIILDYQSSISSSEARSKIQKKERLDNILPKEIIEYIKNNHLYQ